jgi:hypothetical protein
MICCHFLPGGCGLVTAAVAAATDVAEAKKGGRVRTALADVLLLLAESTIVC